MSADRLAQYAASQGITLREARRRLIRIALDHLDARTRGAAAVNQRLTPEERSARARHAVQIREARRQSG